MVGARGQRNRLNRVDEVQGPYWPYYRAIVPQYKQPPKTISNLPKQLPYEKRQTASNFPVGAYFWNMNQLTNSQ